MAKTSMKTREIISRFLPPLLWVLVIFFFSAQPSPYETVFDRPLPTSTPTLTQGATTQASVQPASTSPFQKLSDIFPKTDDEREVLGRYLHAAEYAVLAFLLARTLIWKDRPSLVLLLAAFFLSVLYALSDEYHQLFVPGRRFETGDILLDILGAILGILFFIQISGHKARRTGTT